MNNCWTKSRKNGKHGSSFTAFCWIGIFHLISAPPPCRGYIFFIVIPLKNSKLKTFHPRRIPKFQAQNPLPLKNSKPKTFYPWRIPSSKPFTPEEFQALKIFNLKPLYPWRIPSSKPFTPEEFQARNPLPLKIPSSKPFSPEEFQAQNPLPLKNSKFKTLYPWRIPGILDRGGTDIKWNSPFDVHSDGAVGIRWKKWLTRFKNLLLALDVDDTKRQRARLLHYAGVSVNEIFKTEAGEDEDPFEKAATALCISQFQLRPSPPPPPGTVWGICNAYLSPRAGICSCVFFVNIGLLPREFVAHREKTAATSFLCCMPKWRLLNTLNKFYIIYYCWMLVFKCESMFKIFLQSILYIL